MKKDGTTDPDVLLDKALREWEVKDPLPPRFDERVWRRIACREREAPAGFWRRLSDGVALALARPSLAAGYVTLLLLAGLLAGYWHARLDTARESRILGARYVQMLEPYQVPR